LFHFTPERPEHKEKPAQKLAQPIHQWLLQRNSIGDLLLIRADSTSTNTGTQGGAITHLEKLVGHKCTWDICETHTNELPLRHLIKALDGPFIPRSGFTGPIGKLFHQVNELPRNYNFAPYTDTDSLIKLPDDVINNLSTDQKNCYRLVEAIRTGDLTPELASITCGWLNSSRWLTTGEAILLLGMSEHNLEGENLRKLDVFVRFCIDVYFNLYFKIKVMHHLKHGPQHVVNSLVKLRAQSDEVKNIITDVVVRGSYHAHSENILTALVCSEDKNDRDFAVDKIIKIREGQDNPNVGDTRCRPHRTPTINMDSTSVRDLIDWQEKIYEPVFTCKMNIDDIQSMRDEPLQIPSFSVHTQSCERAVQEVSKSSCAVYGETRRDGWVRARVDHREVLPEFASKKDMIKMLDY
jgi:hypothetical protein